MTRNFFTWIVAALCIAGLTGFACYFFWRGKAPVKKEPERAQQASTFVDVTHDAVEDPGMNIAMTPSTNTSENTQPEPAAPRIVRVVSEEENISFSTYYVEPSEKINIKKAVDFHQPKPGESINISWQSIYLSSVNDFSEKLNWPLLWEVGVPAGILEIRVWIREGHETEVYRLVRHGDEWTGFYAHSHYRWLNIIHYGDDGVWTTEYVHEKENTTLPILALTSRSGWTSFWTKLKTLGILTLPDSDTLPNVERNILDGSSYIVEINDEGRYRSYEYSNLHLQPFPEAKQMGEIIKTLREEFRQSMPKINLID